MKSHRYCKPLSPNFSPMLNYCHTWSTNRLHRYNCTNPNLLQSSQLAQPVVIFRTPHPEHFPESKRGHRSLLIRHCQHPKRITWRSNYSRESTFRSTLHLGRFLPSEETAFCVSCYVRLGPDRRQHPGFWFFFCFYEGWELVLGKSSCAE